ncbi:dihydrofolate reductase family protein [Janibacter hoylei]|uniref:dihydrofolate reductase family protein n=1 Tax=Janibacter hoylei TaxID=364298 RepID=UPI00248FEB42|nr:hypothetical protein [Janibacter hoylei]
MAPTPRLVTYSMNISLDGYIVAPDGGFDWSEPDEEVFAAHTDELRGVGVHLLGRRPHETMSYWETAATDDVGADRQAAGRAGPGGGAGAAHHTTTRHDHGWQPTRPVGR